MIYLLHKHDNLRCKHGSTVTGHGDQLRDLASTGLQSRLGLEQGMHVEYIPSRLDLRVTQTLHGPISLDVLAAAHVPARRFGAEEDHRADGEGGHDGGAKHEPPIKTDDAGHVRNLVESQVGNVAEHDAKRRPDLPLHDERAADGGRGGLGRVDRDRGRFRPEPQSHGEAGDEQMPPAVRKSLPQHGDDGNQTRYEDGAPTAEPVVERDRHPAADEGAAQVRGRIDDTEQPGRAGVLALDAELLGVEELSAIDDSLVCKRLAGNK